MTRRTPLFAATALALALALPMALPLGAETTGMMDHSGHAMHGSESPSTMAFMEANMKMHAGMEIAFTGDADVDFIRGMIAHHQGAIDMARVVLEHGKDAEVKTLAAEIITAQEAEIAWMTEWLAKTGN
jgi:uncharacterized protein (DUF305 family)